jgi:hypothetical protein
MPFIADNKVDLWTGQRSERLKQVRGVNPQAAQFFGLITEPMSATRGRIFDRETHTMDLRRSYPMTRTWCVGLIAAQSQ